MLNHPLEDEEEMEEFEEEEEKPQKEEEFEDKIDMDDDEAMDGSEIIHPYEEVDPLNPPPPSSDFKPEDVIVPTSRSTLQLLPPIRRFSGNFYVREGSSSDAFVANHHSALRDEIQCRNQMEQMVTELEKQVQELKEDDVQKENKKLKMVLESTRNDFARVSWDHYHLRHWSVEVREHFPRHMHYRERPRDTTIVPVAHLDPDDPYVSAATRVPSPKLRGSPRDS
ncbi:hypothetical protein Tco_1509117 [Tanacetum coccineum]